MKFSNMPNIGKTLENKLIDAGITMPEELLEMGSREAFLRIKAIDSTACCNMLYALEGAIKGIRWHYLEDNEKGALKSFYNEIGK